MAKVKFENLLKWGSTPETPKFPTQIPLMF